MMPTFNLYLQELAAFTDLAPALERTKVPWFSVTDRAPKHDEQGNPRDGYERSESLAFGTTVVDLGAGLIWTPYENVTFGAEYLWGNRENENGKKGNAHRAPFSSKFAF